MKRVVLVNGVPASGKSTLARGLAHASGWPLLTLDTVKEALFAHLGAGDREYNRRLGRASYQAIFALIGEFPPRSTAIVDAWFGFQPREVLAEHLARAQVDRTVEIWLRARPELVAERYAARVGHRNAGHPGPEYVPELAALAQRAAPLGGFALIEIDADAPPDAAPLAARVEAALT